MDDLSTAETEQTVSSGPSSARTPHRTTRVIVTVSGEHVGLGVLQHADSEDVVGRFFSEAGSATPPPLRRISGSR